MRKDYAVEADSLKPYIVPWIAAAVAASAGSATGGAGAGGALTAHELNGPYHLGTLNRSQAPWVATDIASAIASHAALPDVHHARQHSVTSSADHSITGAALSLVGATATNTLGLITPSNNPGTTEAVLKSTAGLLTLPNFTATAAVRTPLIDTASGNLTLQPTGSFVKLAANRGIESAGVFASGFTGAGLRIDDGITKAGKTSIEADNLTIRGTMRVYELVIQQIRMTNGSLLVSSTAKVKAVSGTGPYTVTTDGQHGLAVNDLILAQRWNPTQGALTGLYIYRSAMRVTSITTAGTDWQFTSVLLEGDAPIEGAEYGRIGNTTDTSRQGGIYLTSDDTYAPYIDIYNDVDSMADWTGAAKLKVRLGRLDGISDAVLNPAGYGLYSANAFLKGIVSAANDVVRLDDTGARVKATTASAFAATNAYRFTNASGTEMGGVYGRDYTSAHTVGLQALGDATHSAFAGVGATGANASGAATTYVEARNSGGSKVANITLDVTNSLSYILLGAADYAQFNMQTRSIGGHRPLTDLGANLGEASYRWGTLYVNQVIVSGAISGATLSGAEWEYTGSMVIDANSASNTTVSVVNQGAGQASLDVEKDIVVGGLVDGVDVALLKSTYDIHVAAADPHAGYLLATGTRTGATSQAQPFTNGVQVGFGSAAAPSLSFVGDTDTGLMRSAANKLGFVTDATEWATLDSAGLFTVTKTLTAGWVRNSMLGFGGQGANDLSMIGFYDRNELTNADVRGTVTITITGAGTVTTNTITNAFNVRGNYMSITGTDNTTTQIVLHVDLGANQSNYSSANWQPFLQYRLTMNGQATHYRTIVCEVSADNSSWYKPSGGLWETTAAHAAEIVPGLWMGGNGNPSIPGNVYRYVRFTLTNRFEDAGYASKASVWISQVGLRHYAAPTTRAWMHTSGDTMYGQLLVNATSSRAFDVRTAGASSIFKVNTSSAIVTVTGDLDVSDNVLLAAGSASLPALAGSADTNTGLYWAAADTLAVATGGVQRASFSSAGASITGALSVPTINTASGNLSISPAGGTTSVVGALTGNGTAAFTTSVSAPLYTAASGDVTVSAPGTLYLNGVTALGLWVNGAEVAAVNSARLMPAGSGLKDLGDYNRRWATIHAEELAVQTLVAQNVIATIGGDLIVTPTTKLIADITIAAGGIGQSALYTNLAAFWRLEETTGTRYDAKGSSTLGEQGTMASTTGKVGTAASFNGSSFLYASDSATLSVGDINFYLSGWVYIGNDTGANRYIAFKGIDGSSSRAWALYLNGAVGAQRMRFQVWNTGMGSNATVTASTFGNLSINTWYFVEAWHDATANQIGVAVNRTENTTAWSNGVNDDTGDFKLGARAFSDYFTGAIDEFGFWKNAIPSSTDRNWLYNSGAGRTFSNIYLYGVTDINVDVEHNNLRSGEWILLKTAPAGIQQTEKMVITSAATPITGGYRYTASRDQDGTGPNNWYIGDAVASQQKNAGEGYLWLTATSTVHGHTGPGMIGYVRTGGLVNDVKPVFVKGNLRSFVDYVSDEHGDGGGNDLTLTPTTGFKGYAIDRTNGLRLFNASMAIYQSATKIIDVNATDGFNVQAYTTTPGDNFRKLNWWSDLATRTGDPVTSIYGQIIGSTWLTRIEAGHDATHSGSLTLLAENANGTDLATLSLSGAGTPSIDLTAGTVSIAANLSITGTVGTAWTNVTFGTGWGNFGGVYQTAQYKKVGDFVFLRGLVARSSGSGTVIATLPSGYRPPAWVLRGTHTSALSGADRIDIDTAGNINLVSGGVVYVQLDGIVFSTV